MDKSLHIFLRHLIHILQIKYNETLELEKKEIETGNASGLNFAYYSALDIIDQLLEMPLDYSRKGLGIIVPDMIHPISIQEKLPAILKIQQEMSISMRAYISELIIALRDQYNAELDSFDVQKDYRIGVYTGYYNSLKLIEELLIKFGYSTEPFGPLSGELGKPMGTVYYKP